MNVVVEPVKEFTEQEITVCIEQMRQPDFLIGVAFHVATQAILRLVSREHTEHLTMIDGIPFAKPEIIQHVHKSLELDFSDRPLYWRGVAKVVLLEGGSGGLSDNNKGGALAVRVAAQLLLDAKIDSLFNYTLVQLLGLRQQEEIQAFHKLSKIQKHLLLVILQKAVSESTTVSEVKPVPWKPDELFTALRKPDEPFVDLTPGNRVTLSKSLERLSERGLVERLDVQKKVISTGKEQPTRRTAFVKLTELGFLVANRLYIPPASLDH